MKAPNYTRTLEDAKKELVSLKIERFRLDNRITRLESIVHGLSALTEDTEINPAKGLTEGIKTVIRSIYPNGAYPTSVRDKLEEAGFKFTGANPMASIHSILKRLEKHGVVDAQPSEGKVAYYWKPNNVYETATMRWAPALARASEAMLAAAETHVSTTKPDPTAEKLMKQLTRKVRKQVKEGKE